VRCEELARRRGLIVTPSPRRVILEARFGPDSSRSIVVDPGQTVKVGRAEPADFIFGRDPAMSGAHLELSWDGERCRVKDLGSARGTLVDGARVDEAELKNGSWIAAGTTNLMVYFEARRSAIALGEAQRRAVEILRAEPLSLFAVVDAAHGIAPLTLLREAVDRHQSLFDGVRGEALALVAPYLVALRRDSQLLERLVHEAWSKRWAIFLTSARPFVEVRRQLRRSLIAESESDGKKYFLRFFDPSVLSALLDSSTTRQRQQFFGEIAAVFAEGANGELRRFTAEAAPGV
jgi:hypothetical protein